MNKNNIYDVDIYDDSDIEEEEVEDGDIEKLGFNTVVQNSSPVLFEESSPSIFSSFTDEQGVYGETYTLVGKLLTQPSMNEVEYCLKELVKKIYTVLEMNGKDGKYYDFEIRVIARPKYY